MDNDNFINTDSLPSTESVFEILVKRHFGFLIEKYDFKCVQSDSSSVEYQSERVFLRIYWGNNAELLFTVGILPGDTIRIHIEEMIEMSEYHGDEIKDQYYISNDINLEKYIKVYAEYLKEYAHDALIGNVKYYDLILKMREDKYDKAERRMMVIDAEQKASEAWKRKDYKSIVDILTPYTKELSQIATKRYEYAKKRTNNI